MKSVDVKALPAPPSLVRALTSGFDSVANHVTVILLPIALDLFLWFGPHLGMQTLFKTMLQQAASLNGLSAQDLKSMQDNLFLLMRFNLFTFLHSFPVGIPSLMRWWEPLNTPLGGALVLEITSPLNLALAWLGLTIIGLSLGSLYFAMVAHATIHNEVNLWQIIKKWPQESLQVYILAFLWMILMIALTIPSACILSILLGAGLGPNPVALVLFLGFLVSLLFPFVFSPHGIFIGQGRAWGSVFDSIRMTRLTIPATASFVLIVVLISLGTYYFLSRIPNETSWFSIISVAVHAFITSGLLAASFVYYRDANRWIQRLVQQARLASIS